jgi:hypothetical protein
MGGLIPVIAPTRPDDDLSASAALLVRIRLSLVYRVEPSQRTVMPRSENLAQTAQRHLIGNDVLRYGRRGMPLACAGWRRRCVSAGVEDLREVASVPVGTPPAVKAQAVIQDQPTKGALTDGSRARSVHAKRY